MGGTEQLLGVLVCSGLILAGEVQVDIRGFVAIKPEEGFKGDIVAVLQIGGAADRAHLGGQVKP